MPPFEIYPNPFVFNESTGVKFQGMPPESRVNIYTMHSEFVWASSLVSGEKIVWNGRNTQGATVSSGLYFYVVEIPGAKIKKGKIVVIRR